MSGTPHPPLKHIFQFSQGGIQQLFNKQQEETQQISIQLNIWIPEARRMKLPEPEFDQGTKMLLLVNILWLIMVWGPFFSALATWKCSARWEKRITIANATSYLNKTRKGADCIGLLWPSAVLYNSEVQRLLVIGRYSFYCLYIFKYKQAESNFPISSTAFNLC